MKKIIALFIIIISVGFIYIYYHNENTVPILGYHAILPRKENKSGELTIDAEKFEKQLKMLKKFHYNTLTLDEYYCWQQNKCKKPHRAVLITFDDGYQNNYDYAFTLLKKYNMNAVVFYIGSRSGSPEFINRKDFGKIKKDYPNIELASHTFNLHEKFGKEYDEVLNDCNKMKQVMDTKYIAYPHGDWTKEYIKALKDSGYKMAFTFGPGKEHRKSTRKDDPYKIPRLNISKEMPDWKFIARLVSPIL